MSTDDRGVPGSLRVNPDLSWRQFGDQGVVFNAATGDTVLVAAEVVDLLEVVRSSQGDSGMSTCASTGFGVPLDAAIRQGDAKATPDQDELMHALLANDFVRRADPCG